MKVELTISQVCELLTNRINIYWLYYVVFIYFLFIQLNINFLTVIFLSEISFATYVIIFYFIFIDRA